MASSKIRRLALLLISLAWLHCGDKDKNNKKSNTDEIVNPPLTDWQPVSGDFATQTIQAIKVDPLNPATIYIATLEGIYKSTDAGKAWKACNTGLTSKDVTALAINPKNSNMVFCGTWGRGVFKSMDGGQTWQPAWSVGLTPLVYTLLVQSKSDGATVWVGTSEGLYNSDNSGTSWIQVQRFGRVLTVNDLENDVKKMVISIYAFGFYRTQDGGVVWTATNAGTATDSYGQEAAIDFDQVPSQAQVAFALTDRFNLYRTTNGATSWQTINFPKYKLNECVAFAVEPNQPDQMWMASRSNGIYRSTNGGVNWSLFNSGLEDLEVKTIAAVNNSKTQVYVGTVNHGLYRFEK